MLLFLQSWGLQITPVQNFPAGEISQPAVKEKETRKMFQCYHPHPPSTRGLGQTLGQCHLWVSWALPCYICIYLYLYIYNYLSAYLWHVHTHAAVVTKKDQQLPKCQSSIYCQLFMSQVQGTVGLHLWLFSVGKNSSKSFTWERVALFRNHWFWVIFLSLWHYGASFFVPPLWLW